MRSEAVSETTVSKGTALISSENASKPLLFGYARVSTNEPGEAPQLDALYTAGCGRIFIDKASGATASRPALDELLGLLRPGDRLAVWQLNRLGRSLRYLIDLFADLEPMTEAGSDVSQALTPAARRTM